MVGGIDGGVHGIVVLDGIFGLHGRGGHGRSNAVAPASFRFPIIQEGRIASVVPMIDEFHVVRLVRGVLVDVDASSSVGKGARALPR